MKRKILSLLSGLAFLPATAPAYTIILDMDPTTAPVPGLPPGPATGFESTIAVAAGVPFTVDVYFVSTSGSIVNFDHVGLDVQFNAPTDTGALTPASPVVAGSLAAVPSFDYFAGAPVPTVPPPFLVPGFLPPLPGFTASLGGVGYHDAAASGGSVPGFGGPGFMPPPGTIIDFITVDFVLSGSPGDSATVVPSGILDPFAPAGPTGLALLSPPGEAIADSSGASGPSAFAGFGTYVGGTAVVIPEPSGTLLALLGLGATIGRRRR